jgi:hypothetical protein
VNSRTNALYFGYRLDYTNILMFAALLYLWRLNAV